MNVDLGADEGGRRDAAPGDAMSRDAAAPALDGATAAHDAQAAPDDAVLPLTPACGTDLDIDNGRITPVLGALPALTPWAGGELDSPGRWVVTKQSVTVPIVANTLRAAGQSIEVGAGTIAGTAYLPTAPDQPPPLVVLLPGFTQSHDAYETFALHFASHGFVVLGLDTRASTTMALHDKEAAEVLQAIDWVARGASPFAAAVDLTKIAIAGHSKGGKIAAYAAALDPRIDLVIAWDPVNSGGGPCAFDANCNRLPVAPNCAAQSAGVQSFMRAELLVIGAPPDPLFNPDENANAKHFYRGAPSPATLVTLQTSHASWTAVTADADTVRISKYLSLARLLSRFRSVSGLEAYAPKGSRLAAEALLREVRQK